MAPGYHVVMAAVLRLLGIVDGRSRGEPGDRRPPGRVRRPDRMAAFSSPSAAVTTLTLAASSYVVSGSVWLTTDNLGLLLAMTSLALVVTADPSPRRWIASGAFGALSALVRQIHVWTAVPIARPVVTLGAGLPPSCSFGGPPCLGRPATTAIRRSRQRDRGRRLPTSSRPYGVAGPALGRAPATALRRAPWRMESCCVRLWLALMGVFGLPWLAPGLGDAREAF